MDCTQQKTSKMKVVHLVPASDYLVCPLFALFCYLVVTSKDVVPQSQFMFGGLAEDTKACAAKVCKDEGKE